MIGMILDPDIVPFPLCPTEADTFVWELMALGIMSDGFCRELMPWEVAAGVHLNNNVDGALVRRVGGRHHREYGKILSRPEVRR